MSDDDYPQLRCTACGEIPVMTTESAAGLVHPADDCKRGGGPVVQAAPYTCAIVGCALARRGTALKRAHFVEHMAWHDQEWKKADTASNAEAPALEATTRPAQSTSCDRWSNEYHTIPVAGAASYTLDAPRPGARCVALLFWARWMEGITVYSEHCGEVPCGYYCRDGVPRPVPMLPTLAPVAVRVNNDAFCDQEVRVGGRWELPPE